jgi:hypothetical protein
MGKNSKRKKQIWGDFNKNPKTTTDDQKCQKKVLGMYRRKGFGTRCWNALEEGRSKAAMMLPFISLISSHLHQKPTPKTNNSPIRTISSVGHDLSVLQATLDILNSCTPNECRESVSLECPPELKLCAIPPCTPITES